MNGIYKKAPVMPGVLKLPAERPFAGVTRGRMFVFKGLRSQDLGSRFTTCIQAEAGET